MQEHSHTLTEATKYGARSWLKERKEKRIEQQNMATILQGVESGLLTRAEATKKAKLAGLDLRWEEQYGVGAFRALRTLGKGTGQLTAAAWRWGKKRPGVVKVAGAVGAGVIVGKKLEARKRKHLQGATPHYYTVTNAEVAKATETAIKTATGKVARAPIYVRGMKRGLKSARRHWPLLTAAALTPALIREIRERLEPVRQSQIEQRYWKWPRRRKRIAPGTILPDGRIHTPSLQRPWWAKIKGARIPGRSRGARLGRRLLGAGRFIAKRSSGAAIGATTGVLMSKLVGRMQRSRSPYLPTIRTDIEMARGRPYEICETLVKYSHTMDSDTLYDIQSILHKAKAIPGKVKKSVQRSMLAWLLGFISAELLARGITRPKREHIIRLPNTDVQGYAKAANPEFLRQSRRETLDSLRREAELSSLPPGMDVRSPEALARETTAWKRSQKRITKHRVSQVKQIQKPARIAARKLRWKTRLVTAGVASLPLIALAKLRSRRQPQGDYALGAAVGPALKVASKVGKKVWPLLKRVGKHAKKHPVSTAIDAGIGASLVSDLRRKPQPQQRYYERIEMYPFKSEKQRKWMHKNKPEMAKKWEEEYAFPSRRILIIRLKHLLKRHPKALALVAGTGGIAGAQIDRMRVRKKLKEI